MNLVNNRDNIKGLVLETPMKTIVPPVFVKDVLIIYEVNS